MKTAAEILRQTRKIKDLTLEEASKKTRIPLEYLKAIEKGEYWLLPCESYANLYVRDYADFLKLKPTEVVSIYRRDLTGNDSRKKQNYDQKEGSFNYFRNAIANFEFDPSKSKILGIVIITILLMSYLAVQYFTYNSPPKIDFRIKCVDDSERRVKIVGKTNPEVVLKIDKVPVVIKSNGEFDKELEIFPGQKEIEVFAQSPAGREVVFVKPIDCQ